MTGAMIEVAESCLIVVDLQERLFPAISGREDILRKAALAMHGAARLGVPILLLEQNPKALGGTVPEIAQLAPPDATFGKITFSALADPGFRERYRALGRRQVVLLGTEAHVCVLQTALDLLDDGAALFVVADATGSRDPANAQAALRRLERAGATIVTAEMVLFEWLRRAATDDFRALLPHIK